jgi:transcriptional regulator with XRE-family HTH domain
VVSSSQTKIASQLGRALAQARANSGHTQEAVADCLGVFKETISRIERGATLPSLPRLLALAELYDVPAGALLGRNSPGATDIAHELAEQLKRLTEEDRVWVGQWIKELCDRLATSSSVQHNSAKRPR